jgi:hypothetical protein
VFFAAPFTEKVAVRALTRLMAVWAAKSFFWCLALQIHRYHQPQKPKHARRAMRRIRAYIVQPPEHGRQ